MELEARAEFHTYGTGNQPYAWYQPRTRISGSARWNLDELLFLEAGIDIVGARYAFPDTLCSRCRRRGRRSDFRVLNDPVFGGTDPIYARKLPAYTALDIGVEYRYNARFALRSGRIRSRSERPDIQRVQCPTVPGHDVGGISGWVAVHTKTVDKPRKSVESTGVSALKTGCRDSEVIFARRPKSAERAKKKKHSTARTASRPSKGWSTSASVPRCTSAMSVFGSTPLVYEVVEQLHRQWPYCDIDVAITESNGITVHDNGRGISVAIHSKEGVSALEVVMTKIGAGGKFDKDSYKVRWPSRSRCELRQRPLRTSAPEVHRDGKVWEQEYSQGEATYPTREIGTTDRTSVTFQPGQVFNDTLEYSYDTLARRLRELNFLNKGITLTTDERNHDEEGNPIHEQFHSETGLQEFCTYIDQNREQLIQDVIHMEGEVNDIPVEVAMVYNTSFNESLHSYIQQHQHPAERT